MKYIKPALKAERFTVSDSLLGPELSSKDFTGGGSGSGNGGSSGFTPVDDSNAPGGSGGFGYEVWQDAFGQIING